MSSWLPNLQRCYKIDTVLNSKRSPSIDKCENSHLVSNSQPHLAVLNAINGRDIPNNALLQPCGRVTDFFANSAHTSFCTVKAKHPSEVIINTFFSAGGRFGNSMNHRRFSIYLLCLQLISKYTWLAVWFK